jgi:NADH-quinone oxidoreductase subunit G
MALNIIVDGNALQIQPGMNLLEACLTTQLDIPYFCWHKALGSVGACRQCAVKIHKTPDDTGQIVMACMTPATEGLRVSIKDEQAAAFREAVVEAVLTNHPHDCPVCEVGGECHLQDMTVLTGHTTRRSNFPKRTHLNQNLGPFIKHEMNRCIGCYRCVRFYQDYAAGVDFGVFGTNRNIYFGRATDGALESPFAGNLVEVCPTGVFVDKPFSARFRRKWDMRSTPSICPHCAVGCNITVQERAGEFRRVVNRYNETLNEFFLCDRGRFGTGFIESPRRLRHTATRHSALAAVFHGGPGIGIGSPRASVESNFALRTLVGAENFYAGMPDDEAEVADAAVAIMRATPITSLQNAQQADAILLLGDDPLAVAPRLALALRQAAQFPPAALLAELQIPSWQDNAARTAATGKKIPVIIVSPNETWLDDVASTKLREPHDAITHIAIAVANEIDHSRRDRDISKILLQTKSPVIVAGGSAALLFAAANIVLALRRHGIAAQLSLLLPHANSIGLALMAPRRLGKAPNTPAIVLETAFFPAAPHLTVLDHIETPATQAANLAIATGAFVDCDGTFINLEGRAQRFYKAILGTDDPPQAWALLRDAAITAGRLPAGTWQTHAALLESLAAELPEFSSCQSASHPIATEKPPTLPHRFSGRTAMDAQYQVREPTPPSHADSSFGTTMEGAPPTTLAPLVWAPGWNSNQAINKSQQNAPDIFLFTPPPGAPNFPIPPTPWRTPPIRPEELSSLAPAIIARNGGGT